MRKKRIETKVFVEWHSTGKYDHKLFPTGNPGYSLCSICQVNVKSYDIFGCQGMTFKEWFKQKYENETS